MASLLLTFDSMRISDELLASIGVLLVAIFWITQSAWIFMINKFLESAYKSTKQQSTNLYFIFILHLCGFVFLVYSFTISYSGQEYYYWLIIMLLPFLIGTVYLLMKLFSLLNQLRAR